MKILIQRVLRGSVTVDGKVTGFIERGLVVFLGITHTDTQEQVTWLANKLVHLRVFEDSDGKLNRSLLDSQAGVLIVSQFTLYADCEEGRRPSFTKAASSERAKPLYEEFVNKVRLHGICVQTGVFGAMMQVSLVNDGPLTFMIEKESNPGCYEK